MERLSEKNVFSKFSNDESLNFNQIDFVNNVVNYIVKNGSIVKEVLQTYLFNNSIGIIASFKERVNIVKDIVSIIHEVNVRLSI